jgi:hypothetical protein
MRYYSVHAPLDDADAMERCVFVKDGFSWPAFFVPILWILWHRLWLTLIYFIVFVLIIAWTGRLATENIALSVAIMGTILFALEANNIRRLSLERRDWEEIGSSFGRNLTEAEARFFASDKDGKDALDPLDRRAAMLRAATAAEAGAVTSEEPILGLFPESER